MTELGRRERKRQEKLDHIAQTAHRLFEVYGYDAVTMEQLAGAADVAKGTLYSHFPVKEAVLAHWLHMQLEQDLERLLPLCLAEASFKRGMRKLLDASASGLEQHREYMLPYLRYRFIHVGDPQANGNDARSDLVRAYFTLITAGQKSGELREAQPAERLALFFHFLYLAALMRWLTDSKSDLHEEFAAALDLFLKGSLKASVPTGKRASKS
jgi:TetR/AcrR family transcriptional regulator of autoinduction and epiphytic fitness